MKPTKTCTPLHSVIFFFLVIRPVTPVILDIKSSDHFIIIPGIYKSLPECNDNARSKKADNTDNNFTLSDPNQWLIMSLVHRAPQVNSRKPLKGFHCEASSQDLVNWPN